MDANLKIYGIPQSRALRCLWMARELGVPYDNIQVHFSKTQDSPELLAINPNARIPAIDDSGFQLYESMVMTEIEKPVLAVMLHTLGMQPLDAAVLAQTRQDLDRPLAVLEAHLKDRDYLLGSKFTVADLNVASVMVWARTGRMDMVAYPRLADWLKRCVARPAFKG